MARPVYSKGTVRFFDAAIEQAYKSTCKKRHGAVIVKGGSIISTGYNKHRNRAELIDVEDLPNGVTVHAEVDALKKTKNPSGCTIYVVRIDRKGHIQMSKPCYNCWQVLTNSGIERIKYT